jgi:Ras-related protein Rab-6A
MYVFQLFRRVAAALPGMDSTENKPPEDSILCSYNKIVFSCHVWDVGEVNLWTWWW